MNKRSKNRKKTPYFQRLKRFRDNKKPYKGFGSSPEYIRAITRMYNQEMIDIQRFAEFVDELVARRAMEKNAS
ncbi:MAG: hypothetical protein IBJ09_13085 [Bacteroidia bacterium]|nr:hypothetical protein [Bacteroidia bacterium]